MIEKSVLADPWPDDVTGFLGFTQRNLFEILLNQPEIRLYLLFSDRLGSKRTSVWFQINRKMVDTI